jgi:hypothetical protein
MGKDGSNLSMEISYPDRGFCGFHKLHQANDDDDGIVL